MFPARNDFNGSFGPQDGGFGGIGDQPPDWLSGASADEQEIAADDDFGGSVRPVDESRRILDVGLHFIEGLMDL